jgi:hypothetical protein
MKSPTYFIDLRGAIILVLFWSCMITSCPDDDSLEEVSVPVVNFSHLTRYRKLNNVMAGNFRFDSAIFFFYVKRY